jgi:RNA polymerase sigma-54 factor
MRLEANQTMRLDQRQILAPRMIQSMEILQLPMMALQERIQQELEANPFLELRENGEELKDMDPVIIEEAKDPNREPLVIEENGTNAQDFDRLEALGKDRDWEEYFNEDHRPSRNAIDEEIDRKHDAMQNMASRPQSLQDYLTDQLGFLDLDPEDIKLIRHLISHLDDNGFLTVPDESDPEFQKLLADRDYRPTRAIRRRIPTLDEIASSYDEPVDVEDVEEALAVVQKLDPAGVGARELKECLLLQLTPDTPHRDIVRVLIQHHLEDIKHNRLPAIQRRTGYDIAVIKEAIEALKHLNPRPGSGFAEESVPYVVPDVLVERSEDGDYNIRLLDDWLPNISISRRYYDLYKEKGGDPKTKDFLKQKLQAAQWLQESIEQRRNTLERVTRAIITHQSAFLDMGPEHIKPLKMQQIADQVGVHVTTVSRAVDDKYVQTPRGVFPLKRFFGGGKENDSGEEVAWEVIKQKLLEFINQEDKSNPLSDEEIVTKFAEAGHGVARRTVTKYRKMLDIPSSRERKDWA